MNLRRHKYGAKRTICRLSHDHPSKSEATRCDELQLLQRGGAIAKLEFQPKFPIVVNGVKVTTYVADFRYIDAETGKIVTEDRKGFRNRIYILKRKLVLACYGITIHET